MEVLRAHFVYGMVFVMHVWRVAPVPGEDARSTLEVYVYVVLTGDRRLSHHFGSRMQCRGAARTLTGTIQSRRSRP